MTSYEKGLNFELALQRIFEKKGYRVTHNIKLMGRSGTEHQIDLLIEYEAPLHKSKIVLEAKNYELPVNKDRIMKLIQIVDDLGAERGIIVTSSRFTPGALKTAQARNVDLWDREHLKSVIGELELDALEEKEREEAVAAVCALEPSFTSDQFRRRALAEVEKLAKGGFLGRGKVFEKVLSVELILFPLYEVDANVRISKIEKTGFMSERKISTVKRVRLSFDATTGELVFPSRDCLKFPFPFMATTSKDEIEILRSLPSNFSLDTLVGMGMSTYKARNIVRGLAGKGIIRTIKSGRKTYYELIVTFPSDITAYSSRLGLMEKMRQIPRNAKTVLSNVQAGTIVGVVESFWFGNVNSISTVYYPLFLIKFKKEDGSIRHELMDGITGYKNTVLQNRRLIYSSPLDSTS